MLISEAREPDYLEVTGISYRGENYQKLIAFPDRKKFKDGRFIFHICNINIRYVLDIFPEAEWTKEAEQHKANYYKLKHLEKESIEAKKLDIKFKDYPDVFKTKPIRFISIKFI